MGKTISVADLERLYACEWEVELFWGTFAAADDGVEVTVDNVLVAIKGGLSLNWLGRTMFTTPAHTVYLRITNQAWEARAAVVRPAWDKYQRGLGLARTGHARIVLLALTQYRRVEHAADEEYHRACAVAWVEAYEASVEVAGKGDE